MTFQNRISVFRMAFYWNISNFHSPSKFQLKPSSEIVIFSWKKICLGFFFSAKGKIFNHHKPPSSCLAYLSLTAQKNHLQFHFFPTPKRDLWKLIMMINFLTWFLSCLSHWPLCGNPALNHALNQAVVLQQEVCQGL